MTAPFPILYKYETISLKNWDEVSFLEKNIFYRSVAAAMGDKNHCFPEGAEDVDSFTELLDVKLEETIWLICVNNDPAGVWFLKGEDEVVINFYLLPSYKILDGFFASFFYALNESSGEKLFVNLSTCPASRLPVYTEETEPAIISGKKLSNTVEHPHIASLLGDVKSFYS